MPDLLETRSLVDSYLRARVPLIIVESIEPGRVMGLLNAIAQDIRSMTFYEHSRTEGIKELLSQQAVGDDTSLAAALEQARVTFKARRHVNFILTDVEGLEEETTTSRHLAEMVRLAEACSGTIVLMESKPVWSGLSRLGMSVSLDVPTTDELALTLQEIVEDHRGVVQVDWGPAELRRAAEILTGITETEAVNVLMTMLTKKHLTAADLGQLSEYKDRIFGAMAGIERIPLREDYQVGGLHQLQQWLVDRETLMKADLSATPLKPPRGVLLVGVPGCGKSLSAKAIAHNWGLPLYRLDMSAIMGQWVGQSESQLREALSAADRVAPCVLWVDEIEKALAGGSSAHEVTRRLIGQFLFWLQESTSKAFLVATANDVTSLPPELLRKGRFDEMFFVDLPDADDREEILGLYFSRYLQQAPPAGMLPDLVELTDGFSGSDIDAVVHSIASRMYTQGTTELPPDHELRAWFTDVVPYSRSNAEDVAELRAWASGRCLPAGTPPAEDVVGAIAPTRRLIVG
ncbi:MAG: AAA family ATPase [Propioniciclava sp.]